MTYFEREIPVVKFVFEDKEFEFDTLTRFSTKLDNHPSRANRETYFFRITGMDKEFLDYFKAHAIKYIQFNHIVKDVNGSPCGFTDTLDNPIVEITQTLFLSGEYGTFDFTVYG